MHLYIDVGNTSTSLYFCEGGKCRKKNVKTHKNIAIIKAIEKEINEYSFKDAFLASVVPEVNEYILNLLRLKGINVILFTHEDYNLVCDYDKLPYEKMGSDRVIVDSASIHKYGKNVIVIDLGTAVTLDLIKDKRYMSGYIYPGLATSLNALISNASMLNEITFKSIQEDGVCLDTEKQINDGLIIGILGAMSKLIEISKKNFPIEEDYKVVITGGFFNMIVELIGFDETCKILDCDFIYDRDLIIDGMQILDQMIRGDYETRKY